MSEAKTNRRYMLRSSNGEVSARCTEETVRVLRDFIHNPPSTAPWNSGDIELKYTFNEPDTNGDIYVDFDVSLRDKTL
jgi:hypothetical protein